MGETNTVTITVDMFAEMLSAKTKMESVRNYIKSKSGGYADLDVCRFILGLEDDNA